MKKLILLFILLIPITVFAESKLRPFANKPDSLSVSNSSGPQAHLLNPAFAAELEGILSYRYLSYLESSANHLATVAIDGYAFTYGRYNTYYNYKEDDMFTKPGMNFFNLTKGFNFFNVLQFGGGYSFTVSRDDDYNRYSALSLGLLYNPFRFLSLGVTLNDLFATIGKESIKFQEKYSLTLRLFNNKLALSGDIIRTSGEQYKDAKWGGAINYKNSFGTDLFMWLGNDFSLTFGIRIPFDINRGPIKKIAFDGQLSFGGDETSSSHSTYAATVDFNRKSKTRIETKPQEHQDKKTPIPNDFYSPLELADNYEEDNEEITYQQGTLTYSELTLALRNAVSDDYIQRVTINLRGSKISFAQAKELRRLIKNIQENDKTVLAMITNLSNTDYYVASAADLINYATNTMFSLTKFYNADENAQFLHDIQTDRNISDEAMQHLLEQDVISPQVAKELGFIDNILSE